MSYQSQLPTPPPVINRRLLLRMLSLLLMALFTTWAIWKARKPETWDWVARVGAKPELPAPMPPENRRQAALEAPEQLKPLVEPIDEPIANQIYYEQLGGLLSITPTPALTPAAQELRFLVLLSYEHAVPVTSPRPREPKGVVRRAPEPSLLILKKALDRRGFLVPDDAFNRKAEEDANARYHLIELANLADADDLAADALKDVPYLDLIGDPDRFRGQVIHVEGSLRRVNRFAMKDPPPGVAQFYEGWLVAGRPDLQQIYCVLFAELPPGFPPEKDWLNHVAYGVQFDGYFLKVLGATEEGKERRVRLVPVLVGRTIIPPPARAEGGSEWLSIGVTAVFISAVVVCLAAVLLYRRGDRRMADRLAELRNRARLPDQLAQAVPEFQFEEPAPPEGESNLPPHNGEKI